METNKTWKKVVPLSNPEGGNGLVIQKTQKPQPQSDLARIVLQWNLQRHRKVRRPSHTWRRNTLANKKTMPLHQNPSQ